MTEPTIECRRRGRKYQRSWPSGRTETGYDVMAERLADGRAATWVAGFATQVIDNWGRKSGWIVLDSDTGVVILGAGESTRVGLGLGDCLYMFEHRLLEQDGARP